LFINTVALLPDKKHTHNLANGHRLETHTLHSYIQTVLMKDSVRKSV